MVFYSVSDIGIERDLYRYTYIEYYHLDLPGHVSSIYCILDSKVNTHIYTPIIKWLFFSYIMYPTINHINISYASTQFNFIND